jgi:uncharacterized protein YggE
MKPVAVGVAVVLLSATAWAQVATPPPTVTSDGEAFVTAAPAFADFWFMAQRIDATNLDAATVALGFRQAVQAQLEERALKPLSVQGSGVQVHAPNVNTAAVSVRVRFPVVQFASNDEKVKAFATLCDEAAAIRSALEEQFGCALRGPILGVENPEDAEQQAVSRATENALYKADAVASLLQSQVFAVQAVDVLGTEWLLEPQADPEHAPSVTEVTCRGRVRVVYLITPGQ